MTSTAFALGIDVGTSGVRAVALDREGRELGSRRSLMADHGNDPRDSAVWLAALDHVLVQLSQHTPFHTLEAVAVDATSGTVLPVGADGGALSTALMYNDVVSDQSVLDAIAASAPRESAVHGASTALGRAICLQAVPGVHRIVHQADFIAAHLSGNSQLSDESNALKTGYDPVRREWPDWLDDTGLQRNFLPDVMPVGSRSATISHSAAARYGFREGAALVAGLTDGCASFLATGASATGDCVTALGTTLTMKMLCAEPLYNPEFGIYSHRIGETWLAGGASNSGGNVLRHFFSNDEVQNLSEKINTSIPTGLDYYPLLQPGERFPHNDAGWEPRLSPRPDDDVQFLHALFEGMADIERLGYQRLAELGAPPMNSVRSVGGGSGNPAWTATRQRVISAPFESSRSDEAATGTALLALRAVSDA